MRRLLSGYLLLCVWSLFAVTAAPAQVVFIDPCGATIAPFMSQTFNIWLCAEGQAATGITAAEFRIAGLPSTWTSTVFPGTGTMTGDVFGDGVRVAFPSCVQPSGMYLQLFTVNIIAMDERFDVVLMVSPTVPVSDPNLTCSFVELCNAPVFTKVCAGDHGAIINPHIRNCGLAVNAGSWGGVKSLYR